MKTAKTTGALVLSHARPEPMPLPSQMLSGPIRKAVSGIITTKQMKGTKTIWTLAGMTLFKPLYSSARIGTMSSDTKTWPP